MPPLSLHINIRMHEQNYMGAYQITHIILHTYTNTHMILACDMGHSPRRLLVVW